MKQIGSLLFILAIACMAFLFSQTSCSKNENSNDKKARLQIRLTDDPGNYEAVLIDVQDIQINVTGDSTGGWQSLSDVKRGTYDLLQLVNDKDTLLADALIPTGRLHQMRLILGPDNFVKVDGNLIKLNTPSAQQSGLKLNVQQDVTNGVLYTVLLDFDVAKSIVQTGNGKYNLKPVIRTMFQAVGGSIKGVVTPDTLATAVLAIQGVDTVASTYTDSFGNYLIKGLPAGSYSVHYLPGNASFIDEVRDGIAVTTGKVTVVDTVKLHQ